MKRKITAKLLQWKESKNRLPLVLFGARQVGKTYILTEFASQNYPDYIYLNFEQNPSLCSFFEGNLDPNRIIKFLETYQNKPIKPSETLIFLDEIQVCERALTSLKYFAESAPQYSIVAAGSLLGLAIHREKYSFPVGKVQIENLYPLDFEEFLWANGQALLNEEIKNCFKTNNPLVTALHEKALELLHLYLTVGGMPACVAAYQQQNNLIPIQSIQVNILNAYIADMAKYATPAESVKIRSAFDSIPSQLAKENKKFQYKLLKQGASASHFGVAIDWLCAAGIVQKCYRINHAHYPLSTEQDLSAFKLYMTDTGLLCQKAGVSSTFLNENQNYFKGALFENYVAQNLVANFTSHLYYWESQSIAEVDFVITKNEQIIPIEVKSSDNTKSKSLSVFIAKYKPAYAIRISSKNFGLKNNIKSIPHYATYLI